MANSPPVPTDTLIQRIADGHVDPLSLGVTDRRRCVEHLTHQGLTAPEIGSVLRVASRTVTRDRAALRRAQSMPPDRQLGDELLGELERHTFNAIARLSRFARDQTNPPTARLRAEREVPLVYRRFVETVHRLHYLEDGQRRLKHQRETDPAEQTRAQQRMHQATRMLLGGQGEDIYP